MALPPAPPLPAQAVALTAPGFAGNPQAKPAIVVLTHSRPEYLRPTLDALLRLQGVQEFTLYVSADDSPKQDEVLNTAAQAGVPTSNHWRAPPVNPQFAAAPLAKIAHHFRFVMEEAFMIKGHTHLLLLEDDLVPAPDFLQLFLSTAPLLTQDPTLWCISAWNDNGLKNLAQDQERLFRTDYFPGLGWMLTRQLWEELRQIWPESPSTGWDHWMRLSTVSKGRECVVPEVPRTKHIGISGTNVHESEGNSMADHYSFASRQPSPFTGIESLLDGAYFQRMKNTVAAAERIGSYQEMGRVSNGQGLVLYTREQYEGIAGSIGLKTPNPRATYRGIMTVRHGQGFVHFADRRISMLLRPDEQLRPHPSMQAVKAAQGVDCDSTCSKVGKSCDNSQLPFLNTCEALAQVFPCEKGCGHQTGGDIPNYVLAPHQPTRFMCLISDGGSMCNAAHPDTQRLCPCV